MSSMDNKLHKERLQALAEKHKRQTAIESKRSQLDDLVLQLQHLKSKAMRERWLLQGSNGGEEEEESRRQLEKEEEQGRRLEDQLHRLEADILALENEESQISAKEQVLRERLRESERSIEDLQKSLMAHDGVDSSSSLSTQLTGHNAPGPEPLSLDTKPRSLASSGDHTTTARPALFAMEINVQHDPATGEQRVLSANRMSPLDAALRGVKVYDDGRKVVYEVASSSVTSAPPADPAAENGWSSEQVDRLVQRAAGGGAGGRSQEHVTVAPAYVAPAYVAPAYVSPADADDLSPPSCAPPSVPSSPPAQVELQRDARLGVPPPSVIASQPRPSGPPGDQDEAGDARATAEHPVTMVFMGYQDVEDLSEGRRLLGFQGGVSAEVVLIDEDDERSLREKTVTDASLLDGTAADLVSGRPASSEDVASSQLSSDAPPAPPSSSTSSASPPPGLTPAAGYRRTDVNGFQVPTFRQPHPAMKVLRTLDDASEPAPRERALKSVTFQELVSVISDSPGTMALQSQQQIQQQIQHGGLGGASDAALSTTCGQLESQDGEGLQEIRYLDQILNDASDPPTNGNSSPSPHSQQPITIDGSAHSSVHTSPSSISQSPVIKAEGRNQTTFVYQEEGIPQTNGNLVGEEPGRGGARFELRAFQEERRPAKLFTPGEEQQEVRVRRRRPSEEVQELERERQELIRGQAVKKNPGIAQRWWNPPVELPMEEQLDPEQLESHRKYQQRKQNQTHTCIYTQPQVSGPPMMASFDPDLPRKEDIVEEQIDFRSARKQFLQGGGAPRRDVAPQIYSAKPFSKTPGKTPAAADPDEGHVTWADEGIGGEFTCVRAVMTVLNDEDEAGARRSAPQKVLLFNPEESDSGLDELSLRSQDTTVLSLDNVSDSGASLPLTPVSPPATQENPLEEELEFHAGLLVQSAIHHALAGQNGDDWQSALHHPSSSYSSSSSSSSSSSPHALSSSARLTPVSGSPALLPPSSSSFFSSPSTPTLNPPVLPSPSSSSPARSPPPTPSASSPWASPVPQQEQTSPSSPPRPPPASPPQRPRGGGPRIKVQSSYARALAASTPEPAPPAPALGPVVPRPPTVYRPPSPPRSDKPEFSYFKKYSEAAELRSTAPGPPEPPSPAPPGPFRLRSRKQRTLSMIEEEIRAAQQREEDLKRHRDAKQAAAATAVGGRQVNLQPPPAPASVGHAPAKTKTRSELPGAVPLADKMKSNSLPARLTLTARTAPGGWSLHESGKIEKVCPVPPVSPSLSEGALSDAGSEDSGGRLKNYMQTLMEDYESHKVKRRDKLEDNSVLEATRVTRRKSNMALKWEAGIYSNEDGEQGKEEEEEEEEEE
ncbi:palm2 and akap2 fusion isoform X3 [Gadus morhua]|nr:A-kinase anchor protein 2-like isoform X3 [Gadus morhua]